MYRLYNAAGNSSSEITLVVTLPPVPTCFFIRVHLLTLKVIPLQPKRAHIQVVPKVLAIIETLLENDVDHWSY